MIAFLCLFVTEWIRSFLPKLSSISICCSRTKTICCLILMSLYFQLRLIFCHCFSQSSHVINEIQHYFRFGVMIYLPFFFSKCLSTTKRQSFCMSGCLSVYFHSSLLLPFLIQIKLLSYEKSVKQCSAMYSTVFFFSICLLFIGACLHSVCTLYIVHKPYSKISETRQSKVVMNTPICVKLQQLGQICC